MPEFSVEFEVFCSCGEGLCNQSDTRKSRNRLSPQVVVQPCDKCLDKAREEGREAGYAERENEETAT